MQGNLSHISFIDLLLLATSGRKSGLLKLNRGKEAVEIYLAEGNIVHANCPIGDGDKAVLYAVTWGEGNFNLTPYVDSPKTTISKSVGEILDEVKSMTREWKIILELVPSGKALFRIADLSENNTGPVTVPNVGWRVLSKLDGRRTVQEVADLLRIPFAYTAKVIYTLLKSGLVEPAQTVTQPATESVPPALLKRLTSILTDVIGPMAPVVLRDQIESLGESLGTFPEAKLDSLIALIGQEISDAKSKRRFEESVLHEVANFKQF